MEHYNKAISHSATAGMGDVNKTFWIRMRVDIADKHIADLTKNGITGPQSAMFCYSNTTVIHDMVFGNSCGFKPKARVELATY
jgi:hypothetical protein